MKKDPVYLRILGKKKGNLFIEEYKKNLRKGKSRQASALLAINTISKVN